MSYCSSGVFPESTLSILDCVSPSFKKISSTIHKALRNPSAIMIALTCTSQECSPLLQCNSSISALIAVRMRFNVSSVMRFTVLPFATTAKILCPHWAYKTMLFASVVGISPPLAVLAPHHFHSVHGRSIVKPSAKIHLGVIAVIITGAVCCFAVLAVLCHTVIGSQCVNVNQPHVHRPSVLLPHSKTTHPLVHYIGFRNRNYACSSDI